jgi:hypothetical protein
LQEDIERFFRLMVGLHFGVILLVTGSGLNFVHFDKDVILALIGASVVQSGAITYFITKYLFPPVP